MIRCFFAGLLLLLLQSLPLAAAPLVVYETEPLPKATHPLLLGSSLPAVHLSALTTLRASAVDGVKNRLVLTVFSELRRKDNRRYDLLLKPDIHWSDGQLFAARDVEASFKRVVEAAGSESSSADVRILARALYLIESIEALEPNRAQIIFRQTTHPHEVLSFLALLPLTPASVSLANLGKPGTPTLGPYSVVEVEPKKITLRSNSKYYLGAPKIPSIELFKVTEDELRQKLAEEGSSDLAPRILTSMISDLKKNGSMVLRPVDTRRQTYLGYNRAPGSCFEATPGLRLAIASLIDRQGIQDSLLDVNGGGRLLNGPFSAGSAYNDPQIEAPAYSPPLGIQYLTDNQFRRVGESWRGPSGQALTIRLLVYDAVQNHVRISSLIKEQLSQEGIDVIVKVIDRDELTALLSRPRGDYDMILHEWVLDRGEDIFELFHSRGVYNFLNYSNARVDERLELERRAALQESKVLYLREVHRLLSQDPVGIFLWQSSDIAAFRTDIAKVPPLDNYFFFQDVHLWDNGSGDANVDSASPGPEVRANQK